MQKVNWKSYPPDLKIILSIYFLCFLIGTYTHWDGIIRRGFLAVGPDAPLFFRIYWDALSFLDPLAAVLVWVKPKVGIGLAVLIMFTDVIINAYSYFQGFFGAPEAGMVPVWLLLQVVFATFVLVSAPWVLEKWKSIQQGAAKWP